MSEMTQTPESSGERSPRRRFLRRAAIATVVAAGATAIGVTAFAHGRGHGSWHRGGFLGGPLDPAVLDQRVDRMLKHLYVEIDATEAQKQALAPIVKDAARDLLPLRASLGEGRQRAVDLLSQPNIDRAALEALRADQLRRTEEASKRLTQALADVADVLTPEQRKELAGRFGRWRRG
jgi:periplasmic protein CpxP/Spy